MKKSNKILIIMLVLFIQMFLFSALNISDAIRNGDQKKTKSLLQRSPGLLNMKDSKGNTPLHIAINHGKLNIVKLISPKVFTLHRKYRLFIKSI